MPIAHYPKFYFPYAFPFTCFSEEVLFPWFLKYRESFYLQIYRTSLYLTMSLLPKQFENVYVWVYKKTYTY